MARHIPKLTAGSEGFCVYQDSRTIERNLGVMNIDDLTVTRSPTEKEKDESSTARGYEPVAAELKTVVPSSGGVPLELNRKWHRRIQDALGHLPLFLKDKCFAQQAEYRLAWSVSGSVPVAPFIDIKVPEAIPFCSRPSSSPWLTLTPVKLER